MELVDSYATFTSFSTTPLSGEVTTLKIPGLEGEKLSNKSVAFEINQHTYAPLHDHAGNVSHLIDLKTAEIAEAYEYSAFGEESPTQSQASINPWRFAEKRHIQEMGLIHFGFRFYDPSIGRWVSPDPAGFADGPNLYAYLHNDPINHFDRFGLSTESSSSKFDNYFYGEVEKHCFCENHRTCKRGGSLQETIQNTLPKVRHCANFEKQCPNNIEGYSRLYDLALPEIRNLGIGYINGMNNTFEEAKKTAQYISRLAGGINVHAVYNTTHGFFTDINECRLGLCSVATEPVRQLHKMWNDFFESSSKNAKFLMICHSQGAIHVRNALLDYPPELRERILVVAIAPGGYIYKESCAKVIHYRANLWRDPIPRLDQKGARRERETIVTLNSHKNAPYFDHSFISPTYEEKLGNHILKYLKNRGQKF